MKNLRNFTLIALLCAISSNFLQAASILNSYHNNISVKLYDKNNKTIRTISIEPNQSKTLDTKTKKVSISAQSKTNAISSRSIKSNEEYEFIATTVHGSTNYDLVVLD